MAREHPGHVLEVRGRGFLVGVQMASDSAPYAAALLERGLLTAVAGLNVIRLLPPLNASAEELSRAVAIFRDALGSR
jgi:acetylornithine aminotransferase/acetylornithine/N-succinyldiaminopimelate aminotransferase